MPRVRVGELITLSHLDEPSHWGIAVIRWLNHSSDQGVLFGIQMLVPSANPINVRLADGSEQERDYLKGLLLPPQPPREQTHTLLTPAFLYRPGDIVSVRGDKHQEQRYRLVRALECTQAYTRFQFEGLTATLDEEAATGLPRSRDKDFDSVWAGL